MIKAGADINVLDNNEITALGLLIAEDESEEFNDKVSLFLDAGFDVSLLPESQQESIKTPFEFVAE